VLKDLAFFLRRHYDYILAEKEVDANRGYGG
jgi:hypothetical protein